MGKIFKWGIVGPGMIADTFAQCIQAVEDAEIIAVGGRNKEKAEAFSKKYQIKTAYGSCEEVFLNPEVDAVYIAVPNTIHGKLVKKAIEAKKAVLCEKPLALNVKEARELVAYAKEKKVFLMEAVWTRFLPIHQQVKQWIKEGAIGELSMMRGDFAFNVPWEVGDRHINPELGGGALMDVGVYLIAYANQMFDAVPTCVVSTAVIDETKVDIKNSFILHYGKKQLATCVSSVVTDIPNDCYLYGSKGYIHVPNFWRTEEAVLHVVGKEPKAVRIPFKNNGYEYEAMEVMKCVQAGKLESDEMCLEETIEISKVISNMRAEWGLKFPMEEEGWNL